MGRDQRFRKAIRRARARGGPVRLALSPADLDGLAARFPWLRVEVERFGFAGAPTRVRLPAARLEAALDGRKP